MDIATNSVEELVTAARDGDRAALTRLLMEYRQMIGAVVQRFVDQREIRSDVVQNIFSKIIDGLASFRGSCKFSTWVYRLSVNECVDYLRNQARAHERWSDASDDAVFADPGSPDGFELLAQSELRSFIGEILGRLPSDKRAAFQLFYFAGYSGSEAAGLMNISEPNFFMKLKAARDVVRKGLVKKGCSG